MIRLSQMPTVGACLVLSLLLSIGAVANDRSRLHAPYQEGIFEKKSQVADGQDSPNAFGQKRELRAWVWTISIGDMVYELRGIFGDKWLSELPIGSKVEISIGGKHQDRAWIHFDGKKSEAEFEIIGTSIKAKP
jgi:hypothetical protein